LQQNYLHKKYTENLWANNPIANAKEVLQKKIKQRAISV
jgi:hypothetical protein